MSKEPFRLRVLKALTECLEKINPDTGYEVDMKGRVYRGRLLYGSETDIPFISILEAPIPKDPIRSDGANPNSKAQWELLIQGFVDDDRKHPTDPAHELMAQVKMILSQEKKRGTARTLLQDATDSKRLMGKVMEMHIGQGSVRPPDEITDKAYFWLTLTLTVGETLGTPYD